jgi:peptide/nickel transport system permease protein
MVGLVGISVLGLGCFVGPMVLPQLPGHDPVRAALLPPGTTVTTITLTDGGVVIAPFVQVGAEKVRIIRGKGYTELPRARVAVLGKFCFWLGSDRFGRDVLGLLLSGGRISLLVAALSALIALVVGSGVGLAAATGGRVVGALLMRLVDALLAFPVLFLMILVAALFRPTPFLLVVVLGLTSWMGLARLVRGQVLSLRNRTFVLAARSSGSRWHRIWRLHYLPNLAGPLAQDTAMRLGDLVIAEATLSFLGLGIPANLPTWGSMVNEGQKVMTDGWWLATFPGFAIALLVICLALIGDGLQEVTEPIQ